MKNHIEELRGKITKTDLGKMLGVSRQTIHALEKGIYDPSLKLAFKISRHFKKSIEEI